MTKRERYMPILLTALVMLIALLLIITLFSAPAFGQKQPYTPVAGSAERFALMDAIRPRVEHDLDQQVIFKVSRLKIQNGWAFAIVHPRQPDGREIDWSRTRFAQDYEAGMFSDLACVLLRKQGKGWRIVDYALGPSDVAYEDWSRRHGAPRAIFGLGN
jgi:hypothetical protein